MLREHGLVDKLFVTGNGSAKVESLIHRHAPELRSSISLRGLVEREVLADLYCGATAFVSMSSFEGFNLSAAEAATLGVPLLLSDIPVHQELFCDYACLVDEQRIDVSKIARYLADHQLRRPSWPLAARCEPAAVAARYLTLKT